MDLNLSNVKRDAFIDNLLPENVDSSYIIEIFNTAKEDGTLDYEEIANRLNGKDFNVVITESLDVTKYAQRVAGMNV